MNQLNLNKKEFKPHRELTGEHRLGDAGQIMLAFLFFVMWITDSFFFEYSTFLNDHVSLYIRIPVAVALLLISVYLARAGLSIVFGEQREKPEVIRKGVFNVVRHPIYLSEILLYLGLLMLSISLIALLIWLVTIGFLHFLSRYEEKLLITRFGGQYEQYMHEVPMWIPRFLKI